MDLIAPLRTFVKVAEVGSFAAAADALDLSPQLVGKHVQSLEQHLGVRLLNRTTRKQSLTDFGQAYLARARVILEEVEGAEQLATARITIIELRIIIHSITAAGDWKNVRPLAAPVPAVP